MSNVSRLHRHAGGRALSFETDLLAHLPQLRRYARALTGDRAWADDLVQDATERALGRAKSFQAGSNLRAWLFTIMRNLYIDQLRGRRDIAVDDETAPWRQMAAPRRRSRRARAARRAARALLPAGRAA